MDYSWVKKVIETRDVSEVESLVDTGRWEIIGVAEGQDEGKQPVMLYSLGWHGPKDEDNTPQW